jgi:hypothetical protein
LKGKIIPKRKQKKASRSYIVDEPVLKLILGLETLLEQTNLPEEYRRVGYNCLTKFEEMAGLRERKYLDYDIVDYQHQVNIDFVKTIESKEDE